MDKVRENDFTLVTNNYIHFKPLYGKEAIHAGLVILVPQVWGKRQCQLFGAVLEEIPPGGDLINQIMEVDFDNHGVKVTTYTYP